MVANYLKHLCGTSNGSILTFHIIWAFIESMIAYMQQQDTRSRDSNAELVSDRQTSHKHSEQGAELASKIEKADEELADVSSAFGLVDDAGSICLTADIPEIQHLPKGLLTVRPLDTSIVVKSIFQPDTDIVGRQFLSLITFDVFLLSRCGDAQ